MKRKIFIMLLIILLVTAVLIQPLSKERFDKSTCKNKSDDSINIISEIDYDNDGIDDYTDMVKGAKEYIATIPKYKSEYYSGGYPNDGCGVCSDVIWKSFKAAGYSLKDLIDEDIKNNTQEYNIETIDPNIDFRRVDNLKVFFERKAKNLTIDLSNPKDWQPGDIVIFDFTTSRHIAICSDKRNSHGLPYILHHNSYGARESDRLEKYKIIGHYRW